MAIKTYNIQDYIYPDINDALTTFAIKKLEPFQDYWEESEKYIINIVKKYLRNNIRKENSFFLDAGCGDGRLISEFEGFFDNILAIDPDITRLQIAKDTAKKQGFLNKVSFKRIAIEQLYDDQKFDVILCSHVIQHVNTDNVQIILGKLKSLLKKGGLIIIMTSHSTVNHDRYLKSYFENSKFVEERISKEEFNSLTYNNNRVLPIHLFSSRNITHILENLDLQILKIKSFHILSNLYRFDSIIFRDKLLNCTSFLQQRVGRDIFILASLTDQ